MGSDWIPIEFETESINFVHESSGTTTASDTEKE